MADKDDYDDDPADGNDNHPWIQKMIRITWMRERARVHPFTCISAAELLEDVYH